MASQGPNSPGTAANDASIGAGAWVNSSSALSSNNAYAQFGESRAQSNYLKVTNFGFSIPSGATIDGIVVEIERKRDAKTSSKDNTLKIVQAGTPIGTNKASATAYPTTDTIATYGSSTDLWGASWTDSNINSSTFGVALSIENFPFKSANSAYVDHIRITVYYTSGGGGGGSSTNALLYIGN